MIWTRLGSIVVGVCAAVMMTLAPLGAALAQGIPPRPSPPPESNPLVAYIVMVALVGVVCAGALKSSKRSHQD